MATKPISLRVPEDRLAVIDRAAQFRGQSRTDFLLEASYREAVASLSERPLIQFDDQAYEDLVASLEAPAAPNDRLRELLSRSAPWD
jgi:uncharacterized protein (DUF1778 family)